MQKELKAALYIRVSTEEQANDGLSASAQEETLRQYCSTFGIKVYDVFSDLGLSGKSMRDRRGLKQLLEACGNRSFDLVLVWKISRLSRNLKDLLYLIDVFEKNSIHFASCSEKFDTSTPVGRMTLQLLGSIAEFERNTIIENVKLGLKEYARKGGKSSSVLGYDNIDKRLIVNEEEARIVRLVFNLCTEASMSFSAIAKYLNSLGCRTKRGSEFRSGNISYIIRNPVYIGVNRHLINTEGEYCINGSHQPIIEEKLWNRAQEISPTRKNAARSTRNDCSSSLFHVTCMRCKSTMKVFYTFSRGKRYEYLRCSSCSNYVNSNKLKEALIEAVVPILDDKASRIELYRLIENKSAGVEAVSSVIAPIDDEIRRLQKSKSRYLELFEAYKLSDTKDFIDRVSEIRHQIEELEKKKLVFGKSALASSSFTNYEEYLSRIKTGLYGMDPTVLRQLSAWLIKSIEAYRNDIKIDLYL